MPEGPKHAPAPTTRTQQQHSKSFLEKKQRILQALSADEHDYSDASPKGTVDAPIRPLLERINAWPGVVTTSSCSGRVSVFVEGPARLGGPAGGSAAISAGRSMAEATTDEAICPEADAKSQLQKARGGGKGGGRWLYTSHDPSERASWVANGVSKVAEALNMTQNDSTLDLEHIRANEGKDPRGTSLEGQSLVHFKFEPMILHILTASISIAQRVLAAAQQAGFRESGISSATSEMPVVAIRTNGLALESLIGMQGNGQLRSIVDLPYLRLLFAVAEMRFEENKLRMARLQELLSNCFAPSSTASSEHAWEDAETRRNRKRAEGLARQAEQHRQNGADMDRSLKHVDVLSDGLNVP